MGSHTIVVVFAFQNRIQGSIPMAWSCARTQMPGFTAQSRNQLLLTQRSRWPAGRDSRRSCAEDRGEQVTFQGKKISGTILD